MPLPAPLRAIIPVLIFSSASLASARLPEPDTVYFGKVRHNTSGLFTPSSSGEFVILARLGGVLIAQTTLNALSSDYRLNVPMDDGQEPRVPGTVRANERIRVFVKATASGDEHEVLSSIGLGLPLPGGDRGILQQQDMAVSVDLSVAAIGLTAFSAWVDGFGLTAVAPALDHDGDGRSNFQEFVAQTDPTSSQDVFRIFEIRRIGGINAIRFGPVRLSRRYTLWCSPDMTPGSWVRLADIFPDEAADSRWFDHVSPGQSALFYQISVEIQ
jgi:hypothetical protein